MKQKHENFLKRLVWTKKLKCLLVHEAFLESQVLLDLLTITAH